MAGEVLKRKREELGLGIKDVAELLKLKAEYLSSIEEDRFEKLPVAVYTIGYIRCYAAYLHVDPEPILSFYAGHLSHPRPSTIIPVASSKKKIPIYYYGIPIVVLLLIALVVSTIRRDAAGPKIDMASAPPKPAQIETPQQTTPIEEPTPPLSQSGQPPAVSQVQSPKMPTAGIEHRLEVIANDLTWVHITFSHGGTDEALLRPGMTKTWTFPEKAMLKIGNAGGVRLNLDGQDIGSPGSNGQVMTITFPENRQVVPQAVTDEER